jgi:hypothetical protein
MLAFGAYANVDRQAEDELAKTQALTLAQALRHFHNDTGYWPGEGPFQFVFVSVSGGCVKIGAGNQGGIDSEIDTPNWLASAANLGLLFTPPPLCENHPLAALENWDSDTGRGWRGPYLPLGVRHFVDIQPNTIDANGEAHFEGDDLLKNVPAFGAGPDFPPEPGGNLIWRSLPEGAEGYTSERHEFRQHARPLLFLLNPPRVAYWGMNGKYEGETSDACVAAGDDWVMCL